ncbi:MAG: 50S ribosomal protein L22 [Patescibacteria group bacterium]
MATVTAQLNNLRQSPRKVRMIVDVVRGKGVLKALQQLEFVIRRPVQPISKLLRSAIANAENNFNMVASNLYIKEFRVDEGVKLKRFRPKAMGAVGEIQKKTSHISLILAEKVPGLKRSSAERSRAEIDGALSRRDNGTDSTTGNIGTGAIKPEIKTEIGKKIAEPKKGLRKMFQRKSI